MQKRWIALIMLVALFVVSGCQSKVVYDSPEAAQVKTATYEAGKTSWTPVSGLTVTVEDAGVSDGNYVVTMELKNTTKTDYSIKLMESTFNGIRNASIREGYVPAGGSTPMYLILTEEDINGVKLEDIKSVKLMLQAYSIGAMEKPVGSYELQIGEAVEELAIPEEWEQNAEYMVDMEDYTLVVRNIKLPGESGDASFEVLVVNKTDVTMNFRIDGGTVNGETCWPFAQFDIGPKETNSKNVFYMSNQFSDMGIEMVEDNAFVVNYTITPLMADEAHNYYHDGSIEFLAGY